VRKKDESLTAKIFELKQANPAVSNREVARILNINPMTVGKHTRSTEYLSLAHKLAVSNADKVQAAISAAHAVVMEALTARVYLYQCPSCGEERSATKQLSKAKCKCNSLFTLVGDVPAPSAREMAKTLYNTQTAKMMGTKADSKETDDRSAEDKQKLLDELLGLSKRSVQSPN
jgi:hypothetical protein